MCAIDNADVVTTFYHSEKRKAKKEHKCDECLRTIHSGEIYTNTFMVCEGSAATFHSCAHCEIAESWLITNCGGYLSGGVYEDIEEHVHEYAHPSIRRGLLRLVIGLRRQWKLFHGEGLMRIPPLPPPLEEKHL